MRSFSIYCARTDGRPRNRACKRGSRLVRDQPSPHLRRCLRPSPSSPGADALRASTPGFEPPASACGNAFLEGNAARRLIVASLVVLLAAVLAAPGQARKKKSAEADDLFNPLLGVEYSHWLIGPIQRMANEQEVQEYLQLVSDEDAASFIAAFWSRRNEGTELFKKTPEQIFSARAEKADLRYREATFPGRLTDRGTIYILFGEPEETDFESSELVDGPPIEVWRYGKDAAPGLSGEKPRKQYRFMTIDGKTTFFNTRASELEARKRQRRRPGF